MIVKKVASKGGGGGKAKGLSDYIRDEKEKEKLKRAELEKIKDEKVIHKGALNFISDNPKVQVREMEALSQDAPRSKDPIAHYVMSWKENEQPTTQQVDQAVGIFLDEMELTGHQTIYALHQDTNNVHLHLVVNRVHPDTLKVVRPNRGFDIKAAHRAIAKIEHAQGWQRENKGCYRVVENGNIERSHKSEQKQPGQKARDFEQRTGEKSAQRIGIEEAAPVIAKAGNWQQLHRDLGELGIEFQKKGSGAIIKLGETVVKASSVDRSASLGKLEKRLGSYQPPAEKYPIAARSPEPLEVGRPMVAEYIQARHQNKDLRAEEKQDSKAELNAFTSNLAEQHRSERKEMLGERWNGRGNYWQGKGELLNAIRQELAVSQREEREELRQQYDLEHPDSRTQPLPDFEGWLRDQGREDLAEDWRYRNHSGEEVTEAAAPPSRSVEIPEKLAAISGNGAEVYRRHYRQVNENRQGDNVDMSRIDGEIAVRMRATGHSQAEVEQIMAQCAQAIRETAEARNWDVYGKRAAQYAFGAAGDRQMPRLEGHLEKLLELEQGVVAFREREIPQERGFSMER